MKLKIEYRSTPPKGRKWLGFSDDTTFYIFSGNTSQTSIDFVRSTAEQEEECRKQEGYKTVYGGFPLSECGPDELGLES